MLPVPFPYFFGYSTNAGGGGAMYWPQPQKFEEKRRVKRIKIENVNTLLASFFNKGNVLGDKATFQALLSVAASSIWISGSERLDSDPSGSRY